MASGDFITLINYDDTLTTLNSVVEYHRLDANKEVFLHFIPAQAGSVTGIQVSGVTKTENTHYTVNYDEGAGRVSFANDSSVNPNDRVTVPASAYVPIGTVIWASSTSRVRGDEGDANTNEQTYGKSVSFLDLAEAFSTEHKAQGTDFGEHEYVTLIPRASAPTATRGRLYCDTSGNLKFHDGSNWKTVTVT
jgi:hypothetical protein